MKLSELLLKYKSDKNHGSIDNIYNNLDDWEEVENPPPKIGHTYGLVYDEIFELYDKDSSPNILEIGIQKGGSVLAYKEYFPTASIYGVDILDSIKPEYRRDDISYIISDIKSPQVLDIFKDTLFDIIIDDGSHLLSDVLYVVSNYLAKLRPRGTLLIEDCQAPEYWVSLIQPIIPEGFSLTTRDLRQGNSYDNFIILIQKND